MQRKDLVLDLCLRIRYLLKEVMEEENGCNEGSLSMNYDKILSLLTKIEEDRLLYLSFWGDDIE